MELRSLHPCESRHLHATGEEAPLIIKQMGVWSLNKAGCRTACISHFILGKKGQIGEHVFLLKNVCINKQRQEMLTAIRMVPRTGVAVSRLRVCPVLLWSLDHTNVLLIQKFLLKNKIQPSAFEDLIGFIK